VNSVLITGGSGFLGEGLIDELLRRGASRICVYSRGEYRQHQLRVRYPQSQLRWFIGDVRDSARLRRAMYDVDTVIHAAALKRIEVGEYNPSEMFATNIQGSQNVLDAAEQAGVTRAVLVSSDKAYQPVSPYGISKAAAEALFRRHSGRLQTAVVRYGNVAGSTGSVIPTWRATEGVVRITDPNCTRFWMTRWQAVSFVLDAVNNANPHEVLVPKCLPAFRVVDLATAMGKQYSVIGLPEHEKLHESMDAHLSSDKAPRLLVADLCEALRHVP
jgi:UDP-N-acetylglucosamine 4,6-dehydratase/5-epimerase